MPRTKFRDHAVPTGVKTLIDWPLIFVALSLLALLLLIGSVVVMVIGVVYYG